MSSHVAELSGAHKSYGRVAALRGIDVALERGELLAVLGRNGAGKSTAIALLLGLQRPDKGSARIFGLPPQELDVRRRLGVMMQDVDLARVLTVRELIELTSSYYPDPLPSTEVLAVTALGPLARRRYGTLSGGQKRAVQFALAICGRPQVMFLDEPTTGLDVQARDALWANVRALVRAGCAVLLTTHYLEEVEALADRVLVLSRGQAVAAGTVPDIRARVAQRKVSCVTSIAVEDVEGWPGVDSAYLEGRTLHVATSDAEAVARRLLCVDPHVHDLEVRRAGLAEAFAELTQETA